MESLTLECASARAKEVHNIPPIESALVQSKQRYITRYASMTKNYYVDWLHGVF